MKQLIVLSGPSGVGKSTVRKELIKRNPNIWYSISATTRGPREGEQNGVDYYFLSLEEFKKQIEKNNLIEYVEVYKDVLYGTLKSTVLDHQNKGYDVLFEIDVDGAKIIKDTYPNAILIFIMPPSVEILKQRLIDRNTEDAEKIKERIEKAEYEIRCAKNYDYIVINEDINKAVLDIENILEQNKIKE